MVFVEKLSSMKGMPVSIVAEGSVAFSWARFISEELEMVPVFLGMRTNNDDYGLSEKLAEWKKESSLSPEILWNPAVGEVKKAIEKTKSEFIMGSSVEANLGEKLGVKNFLHITNPNTQYVNINMNPF